MKANSYSHISADEARDFLPTDLAYAKDAGQTVLGVLQQHGAVDADAAEAEAKRHFGPGAALRGEGDDIEEGTQWLVIEQAEAAN